MEPGTLSTVKCVQPGVPLPAPHHNFSDYPILKGRNIKEHIDIFTDLNKPYPILFSRASALQGHFSDRDKDIETEEGRERLYNLKFCPVQ